MHMQHSLIYKYCDSVQQNTQEKILIYNYCNYSEIYSLFTMSTIFFAIIAFLKYNKNTI